MTHSPETTRGSCGGRPATYNATDYKNRNVVECLQREYWRGLATRYDKHSST